MITSIPAGSGEGLPNWHELAAAFGRRSFRPHPVTVSAYRLAQLHRHAGPWRRAVVDRRRQLIQAIDAWVAEHVRLTHPEVPIGAYVDEMAAAAVNAENAIRRGETALDVLHTEFTAAASLAARWTEIADGAAPRTYQVGDLQ